MVKGEERFNALYGECFRPVYAYFSVCFGRDIADDLAQQTFMKVWRALGGYAGFIPDNGRAWVFRIAVNVKNDFLRQKTRQAGCEPLENWAELASPPDTNEDSMQVTAALRRLTQADRDLLLLRNMGLTGEEIAKSLAISPSTLRSRMAAAKKRFAEALRDCGVDCDA